MGKIIDFKHLECYTIVRTHTGHREEILKQFWRHVRSVAKIAELVVLIIATAILFIRHPYVIVPSILLLGGLLNKLVQRLNNGLMPVRINESNPLYKTHVRSIKQKLGYCLMTKNTRLNFLCDRIGWASHKNGRHIFTSIGDILQSVGIPWLLIVIPSYPLKILFVGVIIYIHLRNRAKEKAMFAQSFD